MPTTKPLLIGVHRFERAATRRKASTGGTVMSVKMFSAILVLSRLTPHPMGYGETASRQFREILEGQTARVEGNDLGVAQFQLSGRTELHQKFEHLTLDLLAGLLP